MVVAIGGGGCDKCACDLWQVESRDIASYPTMQRAAPQQRIIWPKMSGVARLRHPDLSESQRVGRRRIWGGGDREKQKRKRRTAEQRQPRDLKLGEPL